MRLQELLNKFTNAEFLITVNGWCEELSFEEYEDEKREEYWKKYKDSLIDSLGCEYCYEELLKSQGKNECDN